MRDSLTIAHSSTGSEQFAAWMATFRGFNPGSDVPGPAVIGSDRGRLAVRVRQAGEASEPGVLSWVRRGGFITVHLVTGAEDLSDSLESWDCLTEEVTAAPDVMLALMSGRPELLAIVQPRALSPEEHGQLIHLLQVVLSTNRQLQRHSEQVAQQAGHVLGHMKGLQRSLDKLEDFANFRSETGDDD